MTTDDAGQARPDAPEGGAEDSSNLAALLELDGAEQARLAFADDGAEDTPEPAADSDDDDDEDDEADEAEDSDDDDVDEEDDEDEDEPEPSQTLQPTSAAGWLLELTQNPQRRSEVPKRFHKELEGLEDLLNRVVNATASHVRQQVQTQASRTETLRELWDAGDVDAFREKAAEDPEAHRLFLQQQMEGVDAATAARNANDPQQEYIAVAQQQFERLSAYPEAKARVEALAVQRGWRANAADLAEMTAAVTQELGQIERPSPDQARAKKTQEAARKRKSLPKPDVSRGADSRGQINAAEELQKSGRQLASEAFA